MSDSNKTDVHEDVSFFSLYLSAYLRRYGFDNYDDNFIETRAEIAEESFEHLRREGHDVNEAFRVSMCLLLHGFGYAKTELLSDVIESEFGDKISPEVAPVVVRHLLRVDEIGKVFSRYSIQDNSFVPDGHYTEIKNELTGVIAEILSEYGL